MEELQSFLKNIENNLHTARYVKFIETRSKRQLVESSYIEKHHILPKSLGGSNSLSNMIKLSGREHYIAHMILWKALGGDMVYAFWAMHNITKNNKYQRLNSRQFEELRQSISKEQSKRVSGENHPLYGTHHSESTKKKIGDRYYPKGKDSPFYGKQVSKKTRQKMSKITSDRQKGEGNSFYGKKHSEASKNKMSVFRNGTKTISKNNNIKIIREQELKLFLKEGWALGQPKKNKVFKPPSLKDILMIRDLYNSGITNKSLISRNLNIERSKITYILENLEVLV